MSTFDKIPLVTTIKERCRVCYTCVRECPAKAIRVADGQADVLPARCIGCGNCVQVCGMKAKRAYDSTEEVRALLESDEAVVAIVAPSFPAAFPHIPQERLVGLLRAMGFSRVCDVSFGADLVARQYRLLLEENPDKNHIATTCPAIVLYVEHFFPDLVETLAPLASPMVAMSRVVREYYGASVKVVFIGPCIAKKEEARNSDTGPEIDAVLTFEEMLVLASEMGLFVGRIKAANFDPPHGGLGGLFPLSRGLIQSANLQEDLTSDDIITTDGRHGFVEAVKEFQEGQCRPRLLEILACEGCIMGPGISNDEPLFRRRHRISRHVREQMAAIDEEGWAADLERFSRLDMSQSFCADDQRIFDPTQNELATILKQLGKFSPEDELNCGACGYGTCREHAVAIYKDLAEHEMCLPFVIDQLQEAVKNLARSKEELAQTQETLMHAEKLASMGHLAAGIAHELNNPLGVILMYAHMLLDEHSLEDPDVKEDLEMVITQADRCKNIVAGLLHFARQHKASFSFVDVHRYFEELLKVMIIPENIEVKILHEGPHAAIYMDRDQITQLMINLLTNACHAMPDGGILTLGAQCSDTENRFFVKDTGCGIPEENIKRIFEPFFTTKEVGQGTGMGLAVSYGIAKMHRGDLRVSRNADEKTGEPGTTFTVILPSNPAGPTQADTREKPVQDALSLQTGP
ncbi:MAG: 4Fe-4S dicluster domain-containing protein [Candidatus Hydrogenedens sp.]|jgi:signal transduction histidine kinase/Fe-S-cluster-containing hydrogenase component 2|nr:4Fe-4S dicluster domain-containing protein [Candidatus Hydrogenedens sp.]